MSWHIIGDDGVRTLVVYILKKQIESWEFFIFQ